jgi:DNA-binding NarL/FixJ family response regulator
MNSDNQLGSITNWFLMTQSPDWPSMIADQCEFLLKLLDKQDSSGELKKIALMRLDGASKAQIARELGYTRFTISARINLIQAIWHYHLKLQADLDVIDRRTPLAP